MCNECQQASTAHTIGSTTPPGSGPGDRSIAKQLLHNTKVSPGAFKQHAGTLYAEMPDVKLPDDRPLIDRLHEATFDNKEGLRWIKEKYELRTLVRKAHCFTLDSDTSAMVADFSIAISRDLESARRMALPPFPVTWIELDNRARLQRIRDRGVRLTSGAGPIEETMTRVGWLIYPDMEMGGFYAMYVTALDDILFTSPGSFWWHGGSPDPAGAKIEDADSVSKMALGVMESNVCPYDAFPSPSRLYADFLKMEKTPGDEVLMMMNEIAGELRHIWGFLIALGAGQLGVEARTSEARKHDGPLRIMKNGKPLLPLEHKTLHLHLARKMTANSVIARAVTHHKNREHEVRGHFRHLKSGKLIPVRSHTRGDERLGKIEKTYIVQK